MGPHVVVSRTVYSRAGSSAAVDLDACSPAREAGAGTVRHPGILIEDGAGWAVDVLLVWVGVVDWAASVEETVWAAAVPELVVELEEPHAARINTAAAAAMTHAAGLLAPRGCRRPRQPAR
jgi:hypothetical protein